MGGPGSVIQRANRLRIGPAKEAADFVTLAREMQRSGVRYGVSSACIGGGQGIALLLENPEGV